jgi:predicted nucleic acid-binding protein
MVAVPVLLDTNVLSELSRPRPDARVSQYLGALPLESTFISAVSIAEVERGIVRLQERDPERAQGLRTWLEGTVLPRFATQILPFDLRVASEWGRLVLCRGQNGFWLSWTRVFQGRPPLRIAMKRSRAPSPTCLRAS